jgi:hypothetical protein
VGGGAPLQLLRVDPGDLRPGPASIPACFSASRIER